MPSPIGPRKCVLELVDADGGRHELERLERHAQAAQRRDGVRGVDAAGAVADDVQLPGVAGGGVELADARASACWTSSCIAPTPSGCRDERRAFSFISRQSAVPAAATVSSRVRSRASISPSRNRLSQSPARSSTSVK